MLTYLRKIIVVASVSNTGKTSSIIRAAEKLMMFDGSKSKERMIAGIAYHRGRHFTIGMTTEGDFAESIQNAENFFSNVPLELDLIVIACKSRGASYDAAEKFVLNRGIETAWISTDWNDDIEINIEKTSDLILREIF